MRNRTTRRSRNKWVQLQTAGRIDDGDDGDDDDCLSDSRPAHSAIRLDRTGRNANTASLIVTGKSSSIIAGEEE